MESHKYWKKTWGTKYLPTKRNWNEPTWSDFQEILLKETKSKRVFIWKTGSSEKDAYICLCLLAGAGGGGRKDEPGTSVAPELEERPGFPRGATEPSLPSCRLGSRPGLSSHEVTVSRRHMGGGTGLDCLRGWYLILPGDGPDVADHCSHTPTFCSSGCVLKYCEITNTPCEMIFLSLKYSPLKLTIQ